MLLCRWCKKTIVNAGNPNIIYSNCNDCNIAHLKYRKGDNIDSNNKIKTR